jgi:hypothetical protein
VAPVVPRQLHSSFVFSLPGCIIIITLDGTSHIMDAPSPAPYVGDLPLSSGSMLTQSARMRYTQTPSYVERSTIPELSIKKPPPRDDRPPRDPGRDAPPFPLREEPFPLREDEDRRWPNIALPSKSTSSYSEVTSLPPLENDVPRAPYDPSREYQDPGTGPRSSFMTPTDLAARRQSSQPVPIAALAPVMSDKERKKSEKKRIEDEKKAEKRRKEEEKKVAKEQKQENKLSRLRSQSSKTQSQRQSIVSVSKEQPSQNMKWTIEDLMSMTKEKDQRAKDLHRKLEEATIMLDSSAKALQTIETKVRQFIKEKCPEKFADRVLKRKGVIDGERHVQMIEILMQAYDELLSQETENLRAQQYVPENRNASGWDTPSSDSGRPVMDTVLETRRRAELEAASSKYRV